MIFSRVLSFAVVIAVGALSLLFAASASRLDLTDVAMILSTTGDQLVATDATESLRLRKGDEYLAVTKFARPDGRVLELWLEEAELGRMWSEDITARFSKHEEMSAKAIAAGADVLASFDHALGKRISFGQFGQGYIGFAAGGPRGIGLRAVITMPGLRRDFALTIHPAENDEEALRPEEEAWRDRVQTNYFTLLKAGIERVASQAARQNLRAEEIPWNHDEAVQTNAPAIPSKAKPGLFAPQPESRTIKANDRGPATDGKENRSPLLIGLGLVALTVIAWFLLKGRLR